MSDALSARLSPELRVTLDVIRALAAGYVVVHHLAIRGEPGIIEPFLRFGQEAVMAFFLLSGFVIHANERHRASTETGRYMLRRVLRIYPTLIIAMVISVLVALADGQLAERFESIEAACTVFALQDASALKPGTVCNPFMGNSPLWSLSYEIFFYLTYPLILPAFLRHPRLVNHGIGLACLVLLVGYALMPTHFLLLPAYFLIWWCGAMMAERCLNPRAPRSLMRDALLWLGAATLAWALVGVLQGADRVGTYPVLMLRHFAVSALLLVLALSPIGAWVTSLIGRHGAAAWGYASSISYGVYVIHFPILIQWSLARSWAGLAVATVVLLVASDLADRRMARLVRRFLRRNSPK